MICSQIALIDTACRDRQPQRRAAKHRAKIPAGAEGPSPRIKPAAYFSQSESNVGKVSTHRPLPIVHQAVKERRGTKPKQGQLLRRHSGAGSLSSDPFLGPRKSLGSMRLTYPRRVASSPSCFFKRWGRRPPNWAKNFSMSGTSSLQDCRSNFKSSLIFSEGSFKPARSRSPSLGK